MCAVTTFFFVSAPLNAGDELLQYPSFCRLSCPRTDCFFSKGNFYLCFSLSWLSAGGYGELRVWWNCFNHIQPSREIFRWFLGQHRFLYPNCGLFLECSTHGDISIWGCWLTATTIYHFLPAVAWSHNCHLNPFTSTATFWVWNSLQLFSFWPYLVHTPLAFFLSHVSLWSLIPGVCMNGLLKSTIFDPDPVLNFCHISVKEWELMWALSFMLTVEGQMMTNLNKVKQVRTAGDIWSVIKLVGAKLTLQSGFLTKFE